MYEFDLATPVAIAGIGIIGLNLSDVILAVAIVLWIGITTIRYAPRTARSFVQAAPEEPADLASAEPRR